MIKRHVRRRDLKVRGFSLVELFTTLALISITTGIGYPLLQRFSLNGNLRSAARDIIGDFAALRQKALAESTSFSMTFDVAGNRYSFPGVSEGKTPANFGKDIRITRAAFGTIPTVTFLSRGTIHGAGSVTLTNGRGSTARITCNISGRAYVRFTMR
jgi:Tfp pilus assembly protein FimT